MVLYALISLCLVGLVAIFPFLLPHHGRALAFYHEWTAFALGAAACFPFLLPIFWNRTEIPHAAIYLFALVALIALQTLVIDHPYVTQSLLPGIYLSWAGLLVMLCAWIRSQIGLERAVTLLAWIILVGGALHALVGIVQHLDVYGHLSYFIDRKNSGAAYGNIGQRNHFATHLVLASFTLAYLYATQHVGRRLTVALLIPFALLLAGSSSRAVAVYLVAGAVFSFASYWTTRSATHRRMLLGTCALFALFLLFQLLLPLFNGWLKLVLSMLGIDASSISVSVAAQRGLTEGIQLRLTEWRKAWLIFLESPLWGVGVGNYGWHSFNAQALPEIATGQQHELFGHSHNLIMQILAELGVIGFLLFALLTIRWFRDVWSSWKIPSHGLILMSLGVLALHSSIEYPLWYSYFLGIAAILIGLSSESAIKVSVTRHFGQLVAASVLLFAAGMLFISFLGFRDVSNGTRLAMTMGPQQASEILRAVSKNPLLTPFAELSIAIHERPTRNTIAEYLPLTTRLMQFRPNSSNVYRQVRYLALAGKSQEADALLRQAVSVYPLDLPNVACVWKTSPEPEVRNLWEDAQRLAPSGITCPERSSRR